MAVADALIMDLNAKIPATRFHRSVSHLKAEHEEVLFEEVDATCDLTSEKDLVRCFHPVTMFIGEPPLLSSRIFERWHGETWADHNDL